eukprot:EG_transcript_18913
MPAARPGPSVAAAEQPAVDARCAGQHGETLQLEDAATSSLDPIPAVVQVLAHQHVNERHQYLVRRSLGVPEQWVDAQRLIQCADAIRQYHRCRCEPVPSLPFLWLEKGSLPAGLTPAQCLHFFAPRRGTRDFPGEVQYIHRLDLPLELNRQRERDDSNTKPEALDAAAAVWAARPLQEKYVRPKVTATPRTSELPSKQVKVRYTLTTATLGKPPPWAPQQCRACGTALMLWCEACAPPPAIAPASSPETPLHPRRRHRRADTDAPPPGRPPKARRVGGGRGRPPARVGVLPGAADPFSSLLSLAAVAAAGGWREEVRSDSEEDEEDEGESSDSEAGD